MNPRVLFDKSVFQQTPVSAFVAVDRYLEIVIPPILVREIGGDLASSSRRRKEADVGTFVEKLAARAGVRAFLAHHSKLISNNLLGFPTPMDGRVVAMMDPVRAADGMRGLRVAETPEELALNRWRQHDFISTDYLWANDWQRVQKLVRSNFYRRTIGKWGINIDQPRSLEELRVRIEDMIRVPAVQPGLLTIIFSDFSVPMHEQELACKRFQSKNPRQLIEEFAPYAAFCLKVNLLLGFGGLLFRRHHPHDLRDLEYCYSLPFCEVFASDDNLHKKIVPMLKRPNQMFVGLELVEDLRRLTREWNRMTPVEKVEFARVNRNMPQPHEDSVLRTIWERYRGPNAPNDEPINAEPDEFFRRLIQEHYGSDDILEQLDIDQAPFLIQKIQMRKDRAQELYPGFNFDEEH
jgi:hypothetical protein